MPPSAGVIARDADLKAADRPRWLDLMVFRLPRVDDAQRLILEAINDRQFGLEDIIHRLDEVRRLGGAGMGEWLRSIKAALPSIDHDHFDAIVDLAFGPFSEVATSPPRLDAAVQSVRDLVLTDPGLAALPMSMAIERWSTEISEPNRALRRAALGFLQKAASYNSSAHLQFNYVAGSKHKMLKDAFAKGNPDPKQIKALASDLLNFLNKRFYEMVIENFSLLRSYFSGRGPTPPRICLKGSFVEENGEEETVISILRDHLVAYTSDVRIDLNTGFHRIRQTGSYYLENNIPEAVLNRNYVNPRLKLGEIKQRFRHGTDDEVSTLSANWQHFWKQDAADRASYYKSTLILPLTLWGADIWPEFRSAIGSLEIDRGVFGFLCFDHPEVGYFDEREDVFVGKAFSDFLCSVIFVRMNYTDLSRTYAQVHSFLSKKRMRVHLHKVDHIEAHARSDIAAGRLMDPPKPMPQQPSIISSDKLLVDWVTQAGKTRRKLAEAG